MAANKELFNFGMMTQESDEKRQGTAYQNR